MLIANHVWDFRYTDYMTGIPSDPELIVWEHYRFWALLFNLPMKWPTDVLFPGDKEPWFYWNIESKYDGVPYYVTRIGFIYFIYGQKGGWGSVDRINELSNFGMNRDYC